MVVRIGLTTGAFGHIVPSQEAGGVDCCCFSVYFLPSPFPFGLEAQSMGWGHPRSGWVLLGSSGKPLWKLSYPCPEDLLLNPVRMAMKINYVKNGWYWICLVHECTYFSSQSISSSR